MYYDPMECGMRISKLRMECGKTQQQMADKIYCGIRISTVMVRHNIGSKAIFSRVTYTGRRKACWLFNQISGIVVAVNFNRDKLE